MPIFKRIRRLLEGSVQEVLDRAEHPMAALNALVLELCESLEQARGEVASAMAAERGLARQAADAQEAVVQWDERARRAVAGHRQPGGDDQALQVYVLGVEVLINAADGLSFFDRDGFGPCRGNNGVPRDAHSPIRLHTGFMIGCRRAEKSL